MRIRLLTLFALLVVGSPAAYLVGNVGDDAAFNSYMQSLGFAGYQNLPVVDYTQEIFSIQAKFGNNAAAGNNEIGLHWNFPATSTPPTNDSPITAGPTTTVGGQTITTSALGSIDRAWGSSTTAGNVAAGFVNALLDFTITRLGNTVTTTFRSGSTTVYTASITDAAVSSVDFLALRARSFASASGGTTASRVTLDNIVLNGVAMGNMGNVTTSAGVITISNFVIRDVIGDYTLTGQTTMDWSGANPGNAALAWQIKHFDAPVPEPSTWALMATALICALRLRHTAVSNQPAAKRPA